MSLTTNLEEYKNELLDEIKLFYPNFALQEEGKIVPSDNHSTDIPSDNHSTDASSDNHLTDNTSSDNHSKDKTSSDIINITHHFNAVEGICAIKINEVDYIYNLTNTKVKTFNKLCMYKALASYTLRSMPWGSLTGIRPTKLAYDMLKEGVKLENVAVSLQNEYLVSAEKSKVIETIIQNQQGYFANQDTNILLYVHIPFCKSICSYCAFTAEPVARSKDIIPDYIKTLTSEIAHAKTLLKDMGKSVSAIYIGGGTPTSIDDESFEALLSAFDYKDIEFTCEAGRVDTITQTKIQLMQKYGVNRLCVNPQTLNDSTLREIGRSHTAQDFLDCYKLVKKTDMAINVDLIAGLTGERFEDFAASLGGVLELEPQNITVHTLSIKNGAELKNALLNNKNAKKGNQIPAQNSTVLTDIMDNQSVSQKGNQSVSQKGNQSVSQMTDYALAELAKNGYSPYYLYRQKHMRENLENIGYSQKGKECAYNILSMEEALPVLACGAGGISKMLYSGGRIERLANLRDARLYIEQAKARLTKKADFFLS